MPKSVKLKRDKHGRFICPRCGRPISSLSNEFIEFDRWKWNNKAKKYEKLPTDSRERCICNHCGKPINIGICKNLSNQDL